MKRLSYGTNTDTEPFEEALDNTYGTVLGKNLIPRMTSVDQQGKAVHQLKAAKNSRLPLQIFKRIVPRIRIVTIEYLRLGNQCTFWHKHRAGKNMVTDDLT